MNKESLFTISPGVKNSDKIARYIAWNKVTFHTLYLVCGTYFHQSPKA